jgi:hypothetical protein
MNCRVLAGLALAAATATHAQRVPGRDLLAYPLGLTGEPAGFGSGPASGFWNPATALLGDSARARAAVAALNAPIDLGLTGQVLHGAYAIGGLGTVSLGVAHAAVSNLVRTETDPQSVGDIPYSTWVVSAGAARSVSDHVNGGVALRWHHGHVGPRSASAVTADVGILAHGLPRDGRAAVSTFLFGAGSRDAPQYSAAVDARVLGSDSLHAVRVGYAHVQTHRGLTEDYPFAEWRLSQLTVRGGPVRLADFGDSRWRLRLGIALHRGPYAVAIAREDNASGLSPTYQLALSRDFPR